MVRSLAAVFLASALIGGAGAWIGSRDRAAAAQTSGIVAPVSVVSANGIIQSALDPSVPACTDFYAHACGGFDSTTVVSDTAPSVRMASQAFEHNLDRSLTRLFAQNDRSNPELGRLKTFYNACLASDATIDAPLVRKWLDQIDAAQTTSQLQTEIRALSAIGVDAFFSYSGRPDRTKPTQYKGEINDNVAWGEKSTIARAFLDAGQTPAEADRDASAVVAIASALAAKSGDRYDAKTAEHPSSLADLQKFAPLFAWREYLGLVGAPAARAINVTSPKYLREVDEQLRTRPLRDLKAYLRWSFLLSLRGELPSPYSRAFFDIGPAMRVNADPAGRCRDATVRAMGVEFSRQYSLHILGWKAREAARRVAKDIKRTIVASISQDHWLSASARRATARKLAATDLKIGFPDEWPTVGNYQLSSTSFLENVMAARTFEQRRSWARAGQSRSRYAWDMIVSPWVGEGMAAARLVVPNGFPDAFTNSLIMTAAFLEAPRFDGSAAPEVNYGTFGATFAHEFIHGAEQHMFDKDGQDAELWSAADTRSSEARHQCVIAQADEYSPLPGVRNQGKRQVDENVADYGGVRLAFQALAARMGAAIYHVDENGTSPAQRFFYRYAQNFCTAQTDANLRQSVSTDSHGPPAFRVNGPLSNMPEFGRAFSCRPTAPMVRNPGKQCRVW